MMYTLKGRYAVVTLLLFTLSHGDLFRHTVQRQQSNPTIPPLLWHLAPPWEYILREIILKSVTPSPLDADAPYKRPLGASYYGGPVVAYANDDVNVVLSRGNVYRLLNGHWMLCQDGCVDCEPCAAQRNPLFKWILRWVKRLPTTDPSRHDLQMTIIPQADDHFHVSNFWPNSYIYVTTSQGERMPILIARTQHNNDPENSLPSLENSFSEQHHRSTDRWRLTERDSIAGRDRIPQEDDPPVTFRENASTEKTEREESSDQKHGFGNMRRHRPWPRPTEKFVEEANQLVPKLILGTDQQGQKHLVHVVPADYPSPVNPLAPNHSISSRFVADQTNKQSNNTILKRDEQIYQQIFRRVFDSLNTHRRSIENFLELPANNVNEHRISPSIDNTEVAGFSRHNRDMIHTGGNFEPLYFNDALLPSLYVGKNGRIGKHHEVYRSRYGYKNTEDFNDYHTGYRNTNQAQINLRNQSQMNPDLGRERRGIRIKPYSVNSKNISKINLSISLQNSGNSSIDVIPRSRFSNSFFINSAKQFNFNDTFVDEANNSIELNSITTKRENGQLFNSERLENGVANREFEASHHAFRVIVTTESPVIRREHETLNRSTTLQITTLKTLADSP